MAHQTATSRSPRRRLGTSDLTVFPLGLGGNVFGGKADVGTSEAVLDAYVAAGGNFIDTADSYSSWWPGNEGGESETILGEWIRQRGNRQSLVVATKVGAHPEYKGLSRANVERAVDASLKRLGIEVIDLYYAHFDDPEVPIEEIATTFGALVKAGKIRWIGISNLAPERITAWLEFARANGLSVPVALQPEYNLVSRRRFEQIIAPIAERFGLGVVPYYGIARGFLTGKYRTAEDLERFRSGKAVAQYFNDEGLRVVDVLASVADAHGVAPASVALAWLMAKPNVTAPLASASSPDQVEPLVAAARLELTAEELARLDEASRPFA